MMDNVFFAHPEHVSANRLELVDQEATHASKVLRFKAGDELYASDGKGNVYKAQVSSISKKSVFANILETHSETEPTNKKVLVFGAIKKRDRLEFAVEKAVELGAWEICIFNADHSERSRINEDRMQSIVLSAFKQSKRRWLPEVTYQSSLDEVLEYYTNYHTIMAHVEADAHHPESLSHDKNLLLVGPEGGFSEREVELAKKKNTQMISLGKNRLRAETAALAMLSQFLFTT
ncbi:RsmE family RNA methyltransferase [Gracilimonas sp. BCB1]|uniref:RsmE family RNA methyltransferase n=1 Tax=Gracilimonas sp. BCB1 TaxID=3152362 RepID=UPI0032D98CCC